MNTRGLTLMELVVALAITGLIMAAGYGALGAVIDQRARATEAMDAALRAAAVRSSLEAWVAGARLSAEESGAVFRGLDGVFDRLPDDELTFVTTASTPLGHGEALVRLYVDRDEETPERGLVAAFSEPRGTRTMRLEVEPRVAGLELRYVSHLVRGRRTLPSWISTTVLPAGVELTLVPARGDSLPALLRRPLVVPLASGR